MEIGLLCASRKEKALANGFSLEVVVICSLKLIVNPIQQAKTRVHYNSDHPEFNTELNVLFKVSFPNNLKIFWLNIMFLLADLRN